MTTAETSTTASRRGSKPAVTYFGLLLCAISTTLALLALAGLAIAHIVDIKFIKDAACQSYQATSGIPKFSYCFYSEEWDSATYLSTISTFYTTLITILIALQALISWISFIVIRNSNKQTIESEVEKELPNFFRRRDSDTILQGALNKNLVALAEDALNKARDYEDNAVEGLQSSVYNDLMPQLTGMKAAIEQIEVRVRKLQQDQSNGNDDDGVNDDALDVSEDGGKIE